VRIAPARCEDLATCCGRSGASTDPAPTAAGPRASMVRLTFRPAGPGVEELQRYRPETQGPLQRAREAAQGGAPG
jgi:hypothetical protein